MKKFILVLAMLSIPALTAANQDPFVRLAPEFSPDFTPELGNTEGGLWMIMEDAEDSIKNSPLRIRDEKLNSYVQSVICKLSPEYCSNIRVYIIRRPYFNANMAPNGMMQVWSGLLLRMRNEAQLASVLGHEIGHYLKRHSLKNFNDQKTKSTLLTFFTLGIAGAVGAGSLNADVGRAVIDVSRLGVVLSIFSYTRDAEREADKFGVQLLGDANLDVNEAPRIWENLVEEYEAGDKDKSGSSLFFSTHPDPGERIKNLKMHASEIKASTTTVSEINKNEYWENIGPYIYTFLEDELNLRQYNQTEYLLNNMIKEQVEPGIAYFYLGELYRLRKEEGDIQRSLLNYNNSIQQEKYPPVAHRSIGLIHYKDRKMSMAKEQFEKYLELVPDANDREMIEFYINFGG